MDKSLPLRSTLFWETNPQNIDTQKHADFIIGRVLDFGNLKEWRAIRDFYGLSKIKEAAEKHIFSDPKSVSFWSIMLNIPSKKLKCTRKPSLKTPKAFLMR
jgi:hypothetical protein